MRADKGKIIYKPPAESYSDSSLTCAFDLLID